MLTYIQYIDEWLLALIHWQWSSVFFDTLMPWLRNPYTWSPVYIYILVFMWINYGKEGLLWCAALFLTFACCDAVSASFIKPLVHRLRPCNNPLLSFSIRDIVACGQGYSFPSSHASNHMGISTFIYASFRKKNKWIGYWVYSWAILVCYAQMYVGVHYPSDILAGSILGISVGWFMYAYYTRRLHAFRI